DGDQRVVCCGDDERVGAIAGTIGVGNELEIELPDVTAQRAGMHEDDRARSTAPLGLKRGRTISALERGVERQVLVPAEYDVQAARAGDQPLISVETEVTERDQHVDLRAQAVDFGLHCAGSGQKVYPIRVIGSSQPARTRGVGHADHPDPHALRVEYDAGSERRRKLGTVVREVAGEHWEISELS